jgi:hypothetical protein
MKRAFSLAVITAILACGSSANAQTPNPKGKVCHLEKQCRWENFKKICIWVKVCR